MTWRTSDGMKNVMDWHVPAGAAAAKLISGQESAQYHRKRRVAGTHLEPYGPLTGLGQLWTQPASRGDSRSVPGDNADAWECPGGLGERLVETGFSC
jgi:hypothetical protein